MTVLFVLFIFLLLFFGSCFWVYRFGFYSPNRTQNDDFAVAVVPKGDPRRPAVEAMIAAVRELPYESVSIRSHDGLHLCGRYIHQHDGAPLDICFHGYRGTPARDFSGGTQIILREGHNLLMIEERSHCSSEGHTITFGIEERRDCLDWVRYAVERFGPDTQILLVGISMGAATVLMASELSLPLQVRGIIADCPYSTPLAIIRKVGRDMHLPAGFSAFLASVSARLFGHFDLSASSPVDAVRHSPVPILLIHGEDDHFVPCEMSREILAANPSMIERYTFPGAQHGLSYLVDPVRYENLVCAFSRRVLEL